MKKDKIFYQNWIRCFFFVLFFFIPGGERCVFSGELASNKVLAPISVCPEIIYDKEGRAYRFRLERSVKFGVEIYYLIIDALEDNELDPLNSSDFKEEHWFTENLNQRMQFLKMIAGFNSDPCKLFLAKQFEEKLPKPFKSRLRDPKFITELSQDNSRDYSEFKIQILKIINEIKDDLNFLKKYLDEVEFLSEYSGFVFNLLIKEEILNKKGTFNPKFFENPKIIEAVKWLNISILSDISYQFFSKKRKWKYSCPFQSRKTVAFLGFSKKKNENLDLVLEIGTIEVLPHFRKKDLFKKMILSWTKTLPVGCFIRIPLITEEGSINILKNTPKTLWKEEFEKLSVFGKVFTFAGFEVKTVEYDPRNSSASAIFKKISNPLVENRRNTGRSHNSTITISSM